MIDSPLAYTYRKMLRSEKNEKEVLQILEELFATDVIWPAREKEDEEHLERLKEMGEDEIYAVVAKAIRARRGG